MGDKSEAKEGFNMEAGDMIRILEECGEGSALYDFPGSGLLVSDEA